MRQKYLYLYYFVLILVLTLYTNVSQSPTMPIRLAFLAAMVVPALRKIEWFPAIILCGMGISDNTFAYPFLPTVPWFYIGLSLLFAYLSLRRRDFRTNIHPVFLIALVYLVLNDLVMQGRLSEMITSFIICLSLFICIEDKTEEETRLLPCAFLFVTLAISYWTLFCPEAQMNQYNSADGMVQSSWTDPNYLSAALGIGIVVAVKELLQGGNKPIYLLILILSMVGGIVALVIQASRGMILAVGASIVSLLLLSKSASTWTKVAIVSGFALFAIILFQNQFLELLIARFSDAYVSTGSHRTQIWTSKLIDLSENKGFIHWVLGVGQSDGAELGVFHDGFSGKGRSTHNDYVSMLAYYGLVGVGLFYFAVTYPLRICSASARPYIIAYLVFLLTCSLTIEPFAHGNIVYWGFFFYIIYLARQSSEVEMIEENEQEDEQNDE